VNGQLVALQLDDGSVNGEKFVRFVNKIGKYTSGDPCYLMLDNLRVHHTRQVKDAAARQNIKIIFNAPYSSEFNPIERLWAYAKRAFRRTMAFETRFS
jgi:transposase